MRRSKSHFRFGMLVLAGALSGCALWRKPAPAISNTSAGTVPVNADSMVGGPRDTANTLAAHLRGLDSAKIPSEYASQLYLLALDNFVATLPEDPRVPEVLMWKANHHYNRQEYAEAIREYHTVLDRYPHSSFRVEANQMTAQAFERQGDATQAENWYRRMLSDSNLADRHEAEGHIAQTIYLQGDAEEKSGHFDKSALAYARVAHEFPKSDIAPIALYNAGVMAERMQNWPGAIAYYNQFFEQYYNSDNLPRVLFREAKCRELNGEFKLAGEKYLKLAQTYPQGKEVEPALYNAGFAFASAKMTPEAAHAFEEYALRFPDQAEAPNLLSRAVEAYGELKAWDKVAELQTQFTRRYGGDKSRLVQALSMGGVAELQQGHEASARSLLAKALAEFERIKSPDATTRFYAAKSQQTLGDLEAAAMRAVLVRAGTREGDLKTKRSLLRAAVEHYVGAMEMKIVDGVVDAGFGMAEAFRNYGEASSASLRQPASNASERVNLEEEALGELLSAYAQAAPEYIRVAQIAHQQNINNRNVEMARANLRLILMNALDQFDRVDTALQLAFPAKWRTVEEALSLGLTRAQRNYQALQKVLDWLQPICTASQDLGGAGWDSVQTDSLYAGVLQRILRQGNYFQAVVETCAAAPVPAEFDSVKAFFYQAKLARELLPSVQARATEVFRSGLIFLAKRPSGSILERDSLREALGKSGFAEAHFLDNLAAKALGHPPIPTGLPEAERKTYAKKFEEMGYALRDQSMKIHRAVVESATQHLAATTWAARSFAALVLVEPDRWQTQGRDTVFQLNRGWKPLTQDSVAPGKNRYGVPIPWDAEPDSISLSGHASGRIRVDQDTLATFNLGPDSTHSLSITLTPRKRNLPFIEWKKGKTLILETPHPVHPEAVDSLLALQIFAKVGAGELRLPWDQHRVTEAELDSLRKLPFPMTKNISETPSANPAVKPITP